MDVQRKYATASGTAAAMIAALLFFSPAAAIETTVVEGLNRGFPALRDLDGKTMAHGDFAQWVENDLLHVRLTYDFINDRRVEEEARFRQSPQLVQESWSWRELRDGTLLRRFEVDFRSGKAIAEKREEKDLQRWSEKLEIEPGRSFGGIGFVLATRNLRERLIDGEAVELQAVGFMPQPRAVSVEISYRGRDRMRMSDRTVQGDRFRIHPQIPWLARIFIEAPDTHIWLANPPAPGFLRMEGPLMEPDDPIIRVDLLTGGESGPAEPVAQGRDERQGK